MRFQVDYFCDAHITWFSFLIQLTAAEIIFYPKTKAAAGNWHLIQWNFNSITKKFLTGFLFFPSSSSSLVCFHFFPSFFFFCRDAILPPLPAIAQVSAIWSVWHRIASGSCIRQVRIFSKGQEVKTSHHYFNWLWYYIKFIILCG